MIFRICLFPENRRPFAQKFIKAALLKKGGNVKPKRRNDGCGCY